MLPDKSHRPKGDSLSLRFLFFLALGYVILRLAGVFPLGHKRKQTIRARQNSTDAEEMVLDPQCQAYLPKGDSILRGGHYFCSEECARLYLTR